MVSKTVVSEVFILAVMLMAIEFRISYAHSWDAVSLQYTPALTKPVGRLL